MENPKIQSLIKRCVSAVVMIPIVIGALWEGFPYVNILAMAIGAMLAWEWANMVPNKKPTFFAVVYTVSAVTSVLLPPFYAFGLVLLGCLILAVVKAAHEEKRKLLVLGVPYIALGVGSLVWTYTLVGFEGTMWLFLVVWGVDIGGYFVGTTLKGPKLAPKISPNKTWSGLIGGVLTAVVLSGAFVWYFGAASQLTFYSILAAIIAVIAQVGDLIESAIKRNIGIKDASDIIPGHGGVFDRVDGLIFAAMFMFAYCMLGYWMY